jgi:hypothetical protein
MLKAICNNCVLKEMVKELISTKNEEIRWLREEIKTLKNK